MPKETYRQAYDRAMARINNPESRIEIDNPFEADFHATCYADLMAKLGIAEAKPSDWPVMAPALSGPAN